MIIDAHSHLGYDCVFDAAETREDLLDAHRKYGIGASVVQPFISRPYPEETAKYHDEIHRLCLDYPGEFFGMASINPHFRPEDYYGEAKRCVAELSFVGLKITPVAHAVNPDSRDGRYVFETAKDLNVPVMVHTGAGIPFADPVKLLAVLPDYKTIPVILAHAGSDMFFTQALYLAEKFENVYLEPSWVSIIHIENALKKIGSSKLMFSSDHSANIPVELVKYRTAAKNSRDLENILYKTASDVFGLGSQLSDAGKGTEGR